MTADAPRPACRVSFYAGYVAPISEGGEPEEIRALAARYGIRFI